MYLRTLAIMYLRRLAIMYLKASMPCTVFGRGIMCVVRLCQYAFMQSGTDCVAMKNGTYCVSM